VPTPSHPCSALARLADITPGGLARLFRVELDGVLLSELLSCCDAATAGGGGAGSGGGGGGGGGGSSDGGCSSSDGTGAGGPAHAAPAAAAAAAARVLTQLAGAGRFSMALAMCSCDDLARVARVLARARDAGVGAQALSELAAAFELPPP